MHALGALSVIGRGLKSGQLVQDARLPSNVGSSRLRRRRGGGGRLGSGRASGRVRREIFTSNGSSLR
eukprot:583166-Alexandrium_andersonii.AAC.1